MFRAAFTALILIGLHAGLPAAPVPTHLMPKGDLICYSLRVGDRFVYETAKGETVTLVTDVEKAASGWIVSATYTDVANNRVTESRSLVSPRGVETIEYGGQKLDPPIWRLKLPHAANNEWSNTWPSGVAVTCTTKGWEVVDVPAGRYRAMRVEQIESQNGAVLGTTTLWFAPGFGCIKISGRTPASALKSFTPGK